MKYIFFSFLFGGLVLFSCRKYGDRTQFETNDWLAGGAQTSYDFSAGAFGQSFPNMSSMQLLVHDVGDKAFEAVFVSAPALKHGGLGPIYNNVSCISCHVGDGRGKAPEEGEELSSLLLRLSIPGADIHGGPQDVPLFGGQFQQKAIVGSIAEGGVQVSYTYQTYNFPDGTSYELRTPHFSITGAYAGLPSDVMTSPRIAPPVFGLGLLEAIPDWSILSHQDLSDMDNDGISGKANYVWNIMKKQMTIGKFGWKAGAPSLIQQIAAAYHQDMGITTFLFPLESSVSQSQFDHLMDDVEVSDSILYSITFYMQSLAVPARRDVKDPEVIRGKQLFYDAKCIACHVPKQRTGVNVAFPALSNQLIFPYTDLLLHDMGDGLADHRPDYLASGKEWKTPPLWGIGLTQIVNGHSNFLHDGRARTLLEAIMWHGGEAEASKQFFANLNASDRQALLRFLKSL